MLHVIHILHRAKGIAREAFLFAAPQLEGRMFQFLARPLPLIVVANAAGLVVNVISSSPPQPRPQPWSLDLVSAFSKIRFLHSFELMRWMKLISQRHVTTGMGPDLILNMQAHMTLRIPKYETT